MLPWAGQSGDGMKESSGDRDAEAGIFLGGIAVCVEGSCTLIKDIW